MLQVRKFWIAVCLTGALLAAVLPFVSVRSVSAASVEDAEEQTEVQADVEISERLFSKLTVWLDGGDGYVWASVKNEFTLFPSTVAIILQLYCSDTPQYDYRDMEVASITPIDDLNMGETIIARASTRSSQKYWQGRMRYKENGDNWKELTTPVCLYDASGNFISIF